MVLASSCAFSDTPAPSEDSTPGVITEAPKTDKDIDAAAGKSKADTIKVTVSIDAKEKAAGIGYSVDGKAFGGSGSSYSGVGPSNKVYSFGYRKDLKTSKDVPCGTLTLNQDSKVALTVDGQGCHSQLE